MLQAYNITKSFGLNNLFSDVSFVINKSDKIGLVGLNGCGKSTLLRILNNELTADSGEIVKTPDEKIVYLQQELSFNNARTIEEFIESFVHDITDDIWEVQAITAKLGFTFDPQQKISTLSEGQQMKLKLAQALYQNPTVLLLDEPTNHLDIAGIQWFEDFIKRFNGAIVVISHDREFLNNTVNKIFEIDEQKLNIFEGNYDEYIEQKAQQISKQHQQYKQWQKRRQQLEELLKHSRHLSNAKRRGKAVRATKKRIERETKIAKQNNYAEKYEEARISKINLGGSVYNKKRIIKVHNLTFHYPNSDLIFERTSYELYGKEKVWFYGPNGIGKTTLIKLILGELQPSDGEINLGANLTWEYFSQNQSHILNNLTIKQYVQQELHLTFDYEIVRFLSKFLFTQEMLNTPINLLSPGQRARLSFAVFTTRNRDLLILDEPTNHLDIKTKEVIEDAIRQYQGAVFLVSHDRYFSKSIQPTRFLTIKGKKLKETEMPF